MKESDEPFAFNLQIHTSRDSLEDVIPAVTETPITSSKISLEVCIGRPGQQKGRVSRKTMTL